MPAGEDFLKFMCILKKRKDGGFEHYYNERKNYWRQEEYLAAHGFKSWAHVYEAGPDTLEGFVACQMRPKVKLLVNEIGQSLYVDANYDTPFEDWKFALRHQPAECPVPDWVCVGEVKAECIRLLPKWAEYHVVYSGEIECDAGMSIVALRNSQVAQHGGEVWAYATSTVYQQNTNGCTTCLHESATGFICGTGCAYDQSRVELAPTGFAHVYGCATVNLWPGPDGSYGNFRAYSPGVRVFCVRPGVLAVPERQVTDDERAPVSFEPLPEPMPFKPRADVNMPFGCGVD